MCRASICENRADGTRAAANARPALKISLPDSSIDGSAAWIPRSTKPVPQPISRNDRTSGKYRWSAQTMRSFRARNQKLSASSRASSSKYSTRKPAFSMARLGANASEAVDERRAVAAVRAGPGVVAPAGAARGADLHRSRVPQPVERHLGRREREPQPRVQVDDRQVVAGDRRLDGRRALRSVAQQRRSPDARADALALPPGRDRGQVPVHARVGTALDDEEADELDRRALP